MRLRWYRKYYWTAAEGSWANTWPRNAVLASKDVLQYYDEDKNKWRKLEVVEGPEPDKPQ